jgi:hypothetical protein
MRVLWAATIGMGVLIVAGLVTIVVTLINRAVIHPHPVIAAVAGHAEIRVPAGAHVADLAGAGDRVVMHLVLPDGHDRLLTLDPATGAVSLTIDITSEQP